MNSENKPSHAPATRMDVRLVQKYGSASIIHTLSPLITQARLATLKKGVAARRLDLTLLLDQFYDPHNYAAVLRTAEAFGLLAVHAVPGPKGLRFSDEVSQGADKWLDLFVHNNEEAAVQRLTGMGIVLVGADVTGPPPEALPLPRQLCLVMGAEKSGLSDMIRRRCQHFVSIPMVGFVESFNVSVAAALLMQKLLSRLTPLVLTPAEQDELLARYLIQSVQRPELVLEQMAIRQGRQ